MATQPASFQWISSVSESLVIRMGAGASASWVAVDDTGAILGDVGTGTLADAALAATSRQAIVLVLAPALEVMRASADLPLRSGPRLLQALPFALEEQLAEDVDALHFAPGIRADDGPLPVAVVRRVLIEEWIARLAAAGIRPARLYSEADAVGSMPNTMTLLVQDDIAILSPADGPPATVDASAAATVLELCIAGDVEGETERDPMHVVIYGDETSLAELEPRLESLRPRLASLDLRALVDGPLPRLAAQIVTSPGVNLLQGEFAPRSSLSAYWPAWRLAAALLLALVVAMLGTQLAEAYRSRQQLAAVRAAVDQAFHYVFPDAGPVVDARAELSARLQRLGSRGAGGNHEFLDVLRVVAQALGSSGGARIEAVSYRAGTMELRLRAPSVEVLDRIQNQIGQTGGLQAQIQSANASGSEVIGRLQISRTGG